MQISNLPDREFKVMVIKMHTKLGRMNEHNKNFNRGKGNIKGLREVRREAGAKPTR